MLINVLTGILVILVTIFLIIILSISYLGVCSIITKKYNLFTRADVGLTEYKYGNYKELLEYYEDHYISMCYPINKFIVSVIYYIILCISFIGFCAFVGAVIRGIYV